MLLVLLYGFESWSLTLREEHRLRVFEKKDPWKNIRAQKRFEWGVEKAS